VVEAGNSNFKCEVSSRSSSCYGLEHGVGVVHLILAECERLLLNKDGAKIRFNKKIWNLIADILPHMWW